MPIEREILAIPFIGGVDTKTSAKSVSPTKLLDLKNGEFTEAGTVKKRPGYRKLCTVTGAKAVGSLKNELLIATKQKLYSYDSVRQAAVEVGNYTCVTNQQSNIAQGNKTQSKPDMISVGDVTVVAWQNGTSVYYSIYSGEQMIPYSSNQLAKASAAQPRLVVSNGFIVLLYSSTSTTTIYARLINPVSLTVGSETTVISDLNATKYYDAIGYGSNIYLAYHTDGSGGPTGTRLRKLAYDASGVVSTIDSSTSPALSAHATKCPPGMAITDGHLHLAVATDDGATTSDFRFYRVRLSDFALVNTGSYNIGSTGTTIGASAVCGVPSDSTAVAFLQQTSSSIPRVHKFVLTYSSATTAVSADVSNGPRYSYLHSQGWSDDTNGYVLIGNESSSGTQYSTFLYRHDMVLLGRVLYGTGPGSGGAGHMPRINAYGSDGLYQHAIGYKRQLKIVDTNTKTNRSSELHLMGVKRVVYNHDATPEFQQLGDSVYLNGSMVWAYDGHTVSEAYPMIYPETPTITDVTTGSPAIPGDKQYSYRVYYEWRRGNGERVRGPGSIIASRTTTAGTNRNVLTLKFLPWTNRTDAYITFYRNEGDSLTGQFFRCSPNDPESTLGSGSADWKDNDKAGTTLTFTDNITDAQLTVREQDYQNTGELNNIAPDAGEHLGKAQGRLWLLGGGERLNNLRYSKLRADGEPVAFNEALEVTESPENGGNVTAIGTINNNVIVFKERLIYGLYGEGPNNLGSAEPYVAQQISSDLGCSEPTSVVSYVGGVIFKSYKGFYRLDQSFQLSYVGADVEAYNDQTVTSAEAIPDSTQIVFLTDSGRTLLYDYLYNQWSTFTNHEGVSATVWKDTEYVYLRTNGAVYHRVPGLYLDDGIPYELFGRTAKIHPKNVLQGWWLARKFMVLGTYKSPHRLRVEVIYDQDDAPFETVEFDPSLIISSSTWGSSSVWGEAGTVWGGAIDGQTYQFSRGLKRQKCQAISFQFRDIGADGASYEIAEIALEVGIIPGLARLSTVRKI